MPKMSKKTAGHSEDMGVMVGHYGQLDGYTVGFETYLELRRHNRLRKREVVRRLQHAAAKVL